MTETPVPCDKAKAKRVIFSLFLTYFVFAILLNSVGTVILQVIKNYGVSKTDASVLEGFKDLPIAIVSFMVASFLPRIGYRKSMIIGLLLVTIGCAIMPLIPAFATTKLLFLLVGVSFALVKVSVYSTVGLVTDSQKSHAALMNAIEGVFMIGVLIGYWLFSFFIDSGDDKSQSWLNVYWLLTGACAINFLTLLATPFHEPKLVANETSLSEGFMHKIKLLGKPLVLVFVISAFLYVLIEQGIGSWLPTFNHEILHLPSAMSVQAASIFAACLAVGRLGAGVVMHRFHWYPVLNVCILAMGGLILVSLPLAAGIIPNPQVSWLSAPLAAYVFPIIGLFMAPIYPALNSVMLTALPKAKHSSMTGLIVIFSALGGTIGSRITGYLFDHMSGQTAFYMLLVPLAGIFIALFFFRRETEKTAGNKAENCEIESAPYESV